MCTRRRPAFVSECSLASLNIDTASNPLAAEAVVSLPEMLNTVTRSSRRHQGRMHLNDLE
jgi:hypothetical protein